MSPEQSIILIVMSLSSHPVHGKRDLEILRSDLAVARACDCPHTLQLPGRPQRGGNMFPRGQTGSQHTLGRAWCWTLLTRPQECLAPKPDPLVTGSLLVESLRGEAVLLLFVNETWVHCL